MNRQQIILNVNFIWFVSLYVAILLWLCTKGGTRDFAPTMKPVQIQANPFHPTYFNLILVYFPHKDLKLYIYNTCDKGVSKFIAMILSVINLLRIHNISRTVAY